MMKNFRRIAALLLALCMVFGLMAACGSEAPAPAEPSAPEASVAEPPAEEPAPTEAPAEARVADVTAPADTDTPDEDNAV